MAHYGATKYKETERDNTWYFGGEIPGVFLYDTDRCGCAAAVDMRAREGIGNDEPLFFWPTDVGIAEKTL